MTASPCLVRLRACFAALLLMLSSSHVGKADNAQSSPNPAPATSIDASEFAELEPLAQAQPLRREAIDQELRAWLDKHRFCTDEEYLVPLNEFAVCELSDAAKPRCAAIEKACSNRRPETEGWSFSLDFLDELVWLGWVFQALVLAFALGLVLFLLSRLLRKVMAARRGDTEEDEPALGEVEDSEPPSLPPGETDVDRLLSRARSSAQRGDFQEAIADAYAALLRKLDQDGAIEVHRSKTNGDYRRSLARQPELQSQFAGIVRTVEGVEFGSRQATQHTFDDVMRRVLPLVQRVAGVLLLLAASGLGCQDMTQHVPASALGCGETPGGYSILCEMLNAEGSSARRRIREVDEIDEEVGQVIVLDHAQLDEDEWLVLDEWVQQGHSLVLARVPSPLAEKLQIKRSRKRCRENAAIVESMRDYYGRDAKLRTASGAVLEVDNTDSWEFARCDRGPTLVGAARGDGTVFVLPDSRFLSNISMASADNAYLIINLLRGAEQKTEVLGRWTGSGSSNPFEALNNAQLTPWLLQLLLVAVLVALWRGPHFGRPRDPVTAKRHAFVEHVEALGLKYANSRASRHALANFGSWALSRLQERLMPGSRASLHELAERISRLTGRDEPSVVQILIAAKSAQDEAHDTSTPEEHLKTMRELTALLHAVGGNR